jgi:Ca2+-binding RTX toxin-like protein
MIVLAYDAADSDFGHVVIDGRADGVRCDHGALSLRGDGFNLGKLEGAAPSWQPLCTRSGSERADTIQDSSPADQLCGRLGGADLITGGEGRDRLFGGDGNDMIHASDGTFDVVGCGAGADTVHADRSDYVGVDCERVTRPAPEGNR